MISDAHIHLNYLDCGAEIAETGAPIIAVTCTAEEYFYAQANFCENKNVHVALGVHPWQITEENAFERVWEFGTALEGVRHIGEIGLDRRKEHAETFDAQLRAFSAMCEALRAQEHVISVHSREAGTEVLDILENKELNHTSTCILHGFNGSSEELNRAVKMGCMFSVSEKRLDTKRGREYARQLPADRLLLETDCDGRKPVTCDSWRQQLKSAMRKLSEIRGDNMKPVIKENYLRII